MEKLDTDLLYLKQAHSDGYYEEIQMCIGWSGASFSDFAYYTFNGLWIVRIQFANKHFKKLIVKINLVHDDYRWHKCWKKREIIFLTKSFLWF